ncbi:MAG: type II secretion system protein [Anaerohalosphaera sp.]|nr:type II secretion system protein [Anaerohalosphaera sp.]
MDNIGTKKGFTLIELLVVISIIAMLLAILMPALGKVKDAARLTICKSNQHQLIIALATYAADNDGKYPASHLEAKGSSYLFTWPNHINYHSQTDPARSFNNGGAVHYYLGSYLDDVMSYYCPLSPSIDEEKFQELYSKYDQKEVWDKYNGGSSDISTTSSYCMLWGGWTVPGTQFKGPVRSSDKSKLLVSDLFAKWGRAEIWWLSHKAEGASPAPDKDPVFNNIDTEMVYFLYGDLTMKPTKMKMNAGYTDGHVEVFTPQETIEVPISTGTRFYFPAKWK